MKRRLTLLPILLVLASAPSLRTAARAEDGGGEQKDGGDSGDTEDKGNYDAPEPDTEAKTADENSSEEVKPVEPPAKPDSGDEDKSADEGKGGDEDKGGDEGKGGDEKPMISITKVDSSDGEKPAQAEVSVSDTPKPRTVKKTAKAKSAKAAKAKLKKAAPVKTADAPKKAVVPPPPPPPPPPAVPSTPVEPVNP